MTEEQLTQRLLEAALTEDVAYPSGLEERLTASLHTRQTRTLSLSGWASAAAVVLLIAVSTAIGLYSTETPTFANTCSTPDEARAELQSAMAMLQPSANNGDLLELLY